MTCIHFAEHLHPGLKAQFILKRPTTLGQGTLSDYTLVGTSACLGGLYMNVSAGSQWPLLPLLGTEVLAKLCSHCLAIQRPCPTPGTGSSLVPRVL